MKLLARLPLILLLLALGACTVLPPHGAKIQSAQAHKGDPFAGKWEGKWVSDKHVNSSGRLKCELTQVDPHHYRANFTAYWLALHGSYSVLLQTQKHADRLEFEGAHKLSAAFGGLYRYKGFATPTHFYSTYDSSYDHGRFEMKPVR